jgi:hypothetical protein
LFAVDTVTVVPLANEMRDALATSLTTWGEGGTMRSSVDTAVPAAVLIVRRPDPVLVGTGAVTVVVVDALGAVALELNRLWLFDAVVPSEVRARDRDRRPRHG